MSLAQTILRRTAGFSIAPLVTRFLSILLLPVYTRLLSTADYGILELLDLTLAVFGTIFGVQLSSAIFYFVSLDSPEDRHRTFSTALLGAGLIGCAAALLGFVSAPWIGQLVFSSLNYTFALRLYFLGLAFSVLVEAGYAQLRAEQLVHRFNVLTICRALLQAGLNIVFLVWLKTGYLSILWSNLISSVLMAIYLAVGFYRVFPVTFDRQLFMRMMRYSLPIGVGSLGMLFIHYGDRFVLQRYVNLSEVGIYALSYKIGMLTSNLHGPFLTYWSVDMFHIVRRPDGDHLYVRIFTYFVLVMALGGAFLSIFSVPAVALLAAPEYSLAAKFIPLVTFAYVLRSIGDHLRSIFFIEAQTVTNTKVTAVGFVACFSGYFLLIPRLGVWGAVIATFGAFTVMCLYCFYEAQKVRAFAFEYRRLFLIALYTAACTLPCALYRPATLFGQLAFSSACLLVLVALFLGTKFFDKEELKLIRSAVGALVRPPKPA